MPAARPVWAQEASLFAFWAASNESPEWIAGRIDALLGELTSAFDVHTWRTSKQQQWTAGPTTAEIVRAHVVEGSFGEPEPASGYTITVSGTGPRIAPQLQISAGAISPGGSIPLHVLTVDLREMAERVITGEDGDAACSAIASTLKPAMIELSNLQVKRTARRGGWKIGVGYRTWINKDVGVINHLVDRLTATELAGGTLISAPDDWPAERVVEAMTATLRENGLDEVPH